MFEDQKPLSRIALRIGIAGAIGFGALATGMFVTRKGRHLVKEAWQGKERTRIEDRVLDLLWDDPRLARRTIDVHEIEPGHIELIGVVRTPGERRRTVRLAKSVPNVRIIDDHLQVVPAPPSRNPLKRGAKGRRSRSSSADGRGTKAEPSDRAERDERKERTAEG